MKIGSALLAFAALFVATGALAQSMAKRLYGAKVAVAQLDRAVKFYSVLGMKLGVKHNPDEWQMDWPSPGDGSAVILVNNATGRYNVTKAGSSLLILVPDITATVDALTAAGFTVKGETHPHGPTATFLFNDPDGNHIELSGPTPVK